MRTFNIQHSTLNTQLQNTRAFIGRSVLNVRCWMLVLFLATALPLRADEPAAIAAAAPVERTLDQAELTLLLTQTLQKEYVKDRGELELRVTQPWTAKKISDEPLTVKIIEMPTIGVTPSF